MRALALAFLCVLAAACADDGGGPGGVGGTGAACGGRSGVVCAADLYCDFSDNGCGANDATGTCAKRPDSCPALLVPERTCGCDRRVYSSACEAEAAGADLDQSGACALDQGAFACGYRQCSLMNQLCRRSISDIGDEPDAFTCNGLPSGCRSCSCLGGQPCGAQCDGDGTSGLTLTCPGG